MHLDKAALIVDGRYTLQSAAQTDTTVVTPVQMAETSESDWIARNLPEGGVLGYDPWVHTPDQVKRLAAPAARAGGALKALPANPVDALWTGRPKPPAGPVRPHPAKLTGEGARAKIARLRKALAEARCGALVISDPHNLCWLLNLRGSDVPHTPLAFGYGVVRMKGPVTVVMEPAKNRRRGGRRLARDRHSGVRRRSFRPCSRGGGLGGGEADRAARRRQRGRGGQALIEEAAARPTSAPIR